MYSMSKIPENMSRVLITDDTKTVFEFASYKDGMFKCDTSRNWRLPQSFGGWLPVSELKDLLKLHVSTL